MERIIAFCGIDCTDCDAFKATQENNSAKKKELAESWSKQFGHEIRPEEINCDGCLTKVGRHINYCSICEIRKCGMEMEVENCAYCIDYKCEKLDKFHDHAPNAKKKLDEIRQRRAKKNTKEA